ncbi:MAG: XRE family transcriptional regulator [Eubacteriales bacterium]|nr:XRE family transcriptional regulator [Eubacteriales bacterium]
MRFRDFGQTIATKRKEKKLSQPQLAELLNQKGLNVKANSLSKWEKNVNSPNVQQFFTLCEVLEIEDINETFGVAIENNLYAQLNSEGQKKTLEYMNLLIKSGMYVREEPVYMTEPRILRFYDLPVSAGTGQFLDSDQFSEIEVGDEVSSNADFGVRVAGDSMEPLYCDRQVIWIHEQETLDEGEIGIFYLDGEAYVKKLHHTDTGIELISLNPKYTPIQVKPGMRFKVFGKVVG